MTLLRSDTFSSICSAGGWKTQVTQVPVLTASLPLHRERSPGLLHSCCLGSSLSAIVYPLCERLPSVCWLGTGPQEPLGSCVLWTASASHGWNVQGLQTGCYFIGPLFSFCRFLILMRIKALLSVFPCIMCYLLSPHLHPCCLSFGNQGVSN